MGKRILGLLFLIIGLIGIALSVAGVLLGRQLVQDLGKGAVEALNLTSDTLNTVGETLIVTKETVGRVNDGMETLGTTAINVSTTISETRPMLDQVSKVTSEDVPDGLESIESALPNVAEAAGAIDDALRVLSAFQVERSIFGVPISFDLGVEYNPTVPLDETVLQLGKSIEGMPDELRDVKVHLDLAGNNLSIIGQNIETIATDLASLTESANDIEPLIDDYIRIVTETGDLVLQARAAISEQMEIAELIVTLLFVWIGLNQIIPLYLAADLVKGEKKKDQEPAVSGMKIEPDLVDASEDKSANS